jgi:PAP2 superfamily.
MYKIKQNVAYLSLMLSIPILSAIYPLLNKVSPNGAGSLVTNIDKAIPFIPAFILAYVAWYPFIILTLLYLCIKDKKIYLRTLASIDIGLLVAFVFFYIFQTYVPRPVVDGTDIFSQIVRIIYSCDKPYNCFPSIHVLECYLMMKGIHEYTKAPKATVIFIDFMSVLIIVSTWFVKQHVILDAVGGIYIGEVIFNAVPVLSMAVITLNKLRLKYTTNQ